MNSGRDLTTAMKDAIADGVVRAIFFVEASFASGFLRVHSAIGTITWDGKTWIGVGSLGQIKSLPETSELQAQGMTLALSGIPSDLAGKVLADIRQGQPCRVWFGCLDSSNNVIADPCVAFAGRIDIGSIDEQPETITASVTVENKLIDMQRVRERRYTPHDQQFDFPGDLGFDYVASVQQWNGTWGRK